MNKRQQPVAVFDAFGRDLEITIRIARDGRVYFQDIPADMIAVARALCPEDADLERRQMALEEMCMRSHERQD